jgi:predicted GNAT family acetyltransferase
MSVHDVVVRWQRGWGAARALPDAEEDGDGLRVRCLQLGREVEYFALNADDDPSSIARLAKRVQAEDAITWLTVASNDADRAVAAIERAGLVLLKRSERLMVIDLDRHPRRKVPAPYRLDVRSETNRAIAVVVLDEHRETAASGSIGLSGEDATADKIETSPEHRRRGLAAAVMSTLTDLAARRGAEQGFLVASEEGQLLYGSLGWRAAAEILIATTPGNSYPS